MEEGSNGIKVGSKSDASTQNNWYFEATSDGKYYYLKSQDYKEYFTKEAHYLNYKDIPIVAVDPVDHIVELTDITGDGSYWCVKKSGSGFNIVNKDSVSEWGKDCNYMNYANNGQGAIITYPQSGDIWTFKPTDYVVSANVQNIEYTGKTPEHTTTTHTFSSYPEGISSSQMFINNCNDNDDNSATRTIGGSVSHSVTVTHTETFTKSVSVEVEGGTGLLESILAKATIKIAGKLSWSSESSKSSTGTTTQSYELSNTLNAKPGEYVSSVITYDFIPFYNAPFITTSLVSVVSQTSSGAKTIDNSNLIAELLEKTGSTVIVKDKEYSDTQIEVQSRGVLSTNGAGGEFTVVNKNIPCSEIEVEQPQHDHSEL